MEIFVNIEPVYTSDSAKAPQGLSDKAKAAIIKGVTKAMTKANAKLDKEKLTKGLVFTFTTNEKAARKAAFTLRLKVGSVAVTPGKTSVQMTGELNIFPNNEMISSSLSGNGAYEGSFSDADTADVVEAIAENMANKALPVMQAKAAP